MIQARLTRIRQLLTQIDRYNAIVLTNDFSSEALKGLKDNVREITDQVKDEVDQIKDEVDNW